MSRWRSRVTVAHRPSAVPMSSVLSFSQSRRQQVVGGVGIGEEPVVGRNIPNAPTPNGVHLPPPYILRRGRPYDRSPPFQHAFSLGPNLTS